MAEQERVFGGSDGATGSKLSLSSLGLRSDPRSDVYQANIDHAADKIKSSVHEATDNFKSSWRNRTGTATPGSGAEQDRFGSHFSRPSSNPINTINASTVGLLQSTLLPSFGLQSGLSVVAYAAARATSRVELKDWLWPSGQILNAWWSAIGARMYYNNVSFSAALADLSYPEKLLLGGVSAWGLRLFYRIVTRSISRGRDDPRYEGLKQDPNFWNKALFSLFLPEAAFQTLISLPFTLPFRAREACALAAPAPMYAGLAHSLAVFIFGSGFALEVLADAELARHRDTNSRDINRDGVWSIVRHPNYLGDAHVHASFPLLLYSCGLMHPLVLVGPIMNYVFLRFVGGDKENEANQQERYRKEDPEKYRQYQVYKRQVNSFWPAVSEITNPWYLVVVGAGVSIAALERLARQFL